MPTSQGSHQNIQSSNQLGTKQEIEQVNHAAKQAPCAVGLIPVLAADMFLINTAAPRSIKCSFIMVILVDMLSKLQTTSPNTAYVGNFY